MSSMAGQVHTMEPGETNRLYFDWGENTPQRKTGRLTAGDTVTSCTAAVVSAPSGATLTLGAVSVPENTSSDDVCGRVWSTGEVTACTVTTSATQAEGMYVVRFTATTANGYTIKGRCRIIVSNG